MSDLQRFRKLQPFYERIIEILKYRSHKNDSKIIQAFLIDTEQRRGEFKLTKHDLKALEKWAALQINNPNYY